MKIPFRTTSPVDSSAGLAPDVAALVGAARRRGIPCLRHPEGAGLVQLGWGRRARRIQGAATWNASLVAVEIARDNGLAKSLLRGAGVPVPDGGVVASAREAVEVLQRIGAPVVVKPVEGSTVKPNQGGAGGIATGLATDDAVRAAFERVRRRAAAVLVERELAGEDHRILVVNGRFVAAARLSVPDVTGDGFRTVLGLIEAQNRRPSRDAARVPIPADPTTQEVLARQGLALEAVPPAGMRVKLRACANLAAGGAVENVTHRVHPAVAAACERAARAIGLEVAGIDLVCRDVARPLEAQGGGVVAVTGAPDICMHERAGARGIADSVVRTLFPEGDDGRVPLFVVAARGDVVARLIAQALRATGLRTGLATEGEVRIGNAIVKRAGGAAAAAQALVLTSPEVEAAVLQLSAPYLPSERAFDRCDVAVVLGDEHAAPAAAELAGIARTLVIDAMDPRTASLCRGVRVGACVACFHAAELPPAVEGALARGSSCVYLRRDMVTIATADHRIPLMERRYLPGAARIEDALAAIAALWAYGLEESAIAAALCARPGGVRDGEDRICAAPQASHAQR